jgi:hypothetical protein
MSAASSRAFRLHGEIPMLLPLIDMCNHSFNPNARIVQEGSVNSLDMSVKVSILWCSCTPKFSIYTLLKFFSRIKLSFSSFSYPLFKWGWYCIVLITMKIFAFHKISTSISTCHLIHSFPASLCTIVKSIIHVSVVFFPTLFHIQFHFLCWNALVSHATLQSTYHPTLSYLCTIAIHCSSSEQCHTVIKTLPYLNLYVTNVLD